VPFSASAAVDASVRTANAIAEKADVGFMIFPGIVASGMLEQRF
jgi:hypothetical protein